MAYLVAEAADQLTSTLTQSDPEFKGYANGNSEPGRGFGHIAYSVDDVQKVGPGEVGRAPPS